MAEKIALEVQINTLNSAESIGALKNGIKELTKELEKLPEGSQEFKNTAAAIGNAKDKLADMNEEIVQTTTKAGKFQAVTGIMSQLASGFALAESAMAMFGGESEVVTQALQKVQAAMGMVGAIKELEGIGDAWKNFSSVIKDFDKAAVETLKNFKNKALDTFKSISEVKFSDAMSMMKNGIVNFAKSGISALRSLWATMLANPITAILVGLTALGAAIAYLVTREDEETKALKRNIDAREKSMAQLEKENEAINRATKFRIDLAKAEGKSEQEILELEKKSALERIKQLNKLNDEKRKNLNDLKKLISDADDDEREELVKKYNENIELLDKNKKEIQDIERDYAVKYKQLQTNERKKEEEAQKAADEKAKAAAEKRKQDRLKEAEDEKKRQEELRAGIEKNRLEELQTLENQRKDLENHNELTYEKKVEFENAKYKLETEKAGLIYEELEKLRVEHDANLKAIDEEKAKNEKEANEKRIADEIAAEEEYDAYIKDIEAKRLERKKAIKDAEVQLLIDSLNLVSAITTEFAGKDEASQRKAFEINKKVQLALATIEMIKGVQSAFTAAQASPFTAVFPGYPYVQAGLAAAYGLMNIRKISQTKFEGGGGAGGGMADAGAGAGGAMSAPLQNGVNNTSTNLSNLAQGQQEQKPIKAYVLQTDVASEDQKMKAIENKAKIE